MRKSLAVMALAVVALAAPVFAEGDLEPIPLELPKPNFGGTPLDYWGDHLEEPVYNRPPFLAPKGTTNVAKGKKVTASVDKPLLGKLEMVTDGNKEWEEKNVVELEKGHQWAQIDLGADHEIFAVVIWHYHAAERVYFDVAVQVASDADFTKDVETIFNNDYDNSSGAGVGEDLEFIENYKGKIIDAGGVKARYVRLYSNGNTSGDTNHYTEVEVYAKPAK